MGFVMFEQHETVDLVLDPGIRNFVLIPILVVVICKTFLTTNLMTCMKKPPPKKKKEKVVDGNCMMRSAKLRGGCHWIPEDGFEMRRHQYAKEMLKEVEVPEVPPEQSMQDMNNMMSMMQGNTVSMVSHIGFMFWVNTFFTGFLIIRLPFPVPESARQIVQRGIAMKSLECAYVSSLSWYFMSMIGARGLTTAMSGGNVVDDMKMMKDQMANPMGGGQPQMGGKYDPNPMFKAEREELGIVDRTFNLEFAERRLLEMWG